MELPWKLNLLESLTVISFCLSKCIAVPAISFSKMWLTKWAVFKRYFESQKRWNAKRLQCWQDIMKPAYHFLDFMCNFSTRNTSSSKCNWVISSLRSCIQSPHNKVLWLALFWKIILDFGSFRFHDLFVCLFWTPSDMDESSVFQEIKESMSLTF